MIEINNLTKAYGHGANATTVLDGVDFTVEQGEIFAVVGPSGAGKSTLAQCINLLERPTSGEVIVNGERLTDLDAAALRAARRRIGTVFQSANLLSRKTTAQNVALPLEYLGATKGATRARVAELLDRVGLTAHAEKYPHQLSGGQRQRVGIARALALKPSVLLADEATSGLDPASTDSFLELLAEIRDELRPAVVFITHEMDTVVKVADRVGRLETGRLVEQGALAELLRDPDSALGRSLRPVQSPRAADPGDAVIEVTYRSAQVPSDWIGQLGAHIPSSIKVLAAQVSEVSGHAFGQWTIGVAAAWAPEVLRASASLGLAARVISSDTDHEITPIDDKKTVPA